MTIERWLDVGSTDLPACKCGSEMDLADTQAKENDTLLKIFLCPSCRHEMRVMVWSEETGGVGV